MSEDYFIRLLALADQCLREFSSRELDGEIFCALYGVADLNDLSTPVLRDSNANGDVLLARDGQIEWFASPPFTTDQDACRMLFPRPVDIIPKDLQAACAFALRLRVEEHVAPPIMSKIK